MLKLVILMTALLCVAPASADCGATDTAAEIEWLLAQVRDSGATFLRNGRRYDGERAARHIERKYAHFRDRIDTASDFIRLAATRSETTGKAYRVRLRNGVEMASSRWLHGLLSELAAVCGQQR